jgi:arylsulfatase A-like enzyme
MRRAAAVVALVAACAEPEPPALLELPASACPEPAAQLAAPSADREQAFTAGPPPNILLVIADDFGLDAASLDASDPCYAVGEVSNDGPMPHVAELCRTGARFTHAWAMPQCSPTRAAMLTGRLPMRTGVGAAVALSGGPELPADEVTLPQVLTGAGAGYDLASIGKWHLTVDPADPNRFGWPHHVGPHGGALPDYWSWLRNDNGAVGPSTGYATTVQTDDAIAWLEQRGEAPWLLWFAPSAPHDPYHLPPAELHDGPALPPYSPEADARPYFAAMMSSLDTELGRLFDAVDARGEWGETVVVFVGDNGNTEWVLDPPYDPEHGKGTVYQPGTRVPLLISGPGIAPHDVDAPVSVADLVPTLIALTGLDVQATLQDQAPGVQIDGVSLVSHLVDGSTPARDHVVVQAFEGAPAVDRMAHAISDGRYELVCTPGSVELYDLELDPAEANDLVDGAPAPGCEAVLAELRAALVDRTDTPALCVE